MKCAPFVVEDANVGEAHVKRGTRGRRHNVLKFSNRMLDTTVALVGAK